MNLGNLIQFKKWERVDASFLKKRLGDDWQEAIEKGYFEETADQKFIFTQKGYDFAWKRE